MNSQEAVSDSAAKISIDDQIAHIEFCADTARDIGYDERAMELAVLASLRRLAAAERDAGRLDWLESDMRLPLGVAIEYSDGKFRFPYLVSNAGGFGGGVGEVAESSLREAIDSAIAQQRLA